MSDEEEEFVIEAIFHRVEFEQLVKKALAGEARFNPESIKDGKSKHSKYAYLVHWQGFDYTDRTWEPESNLKKTKQLAKFKEENNMPSGHEKFEKTYGDCVWRNLAIAQDRVKGHQYLMTPQEKRELKEKQQERIEKLRRQNEKSREVEHRKMEKRREKMTTPDDPEKLFKKKKKHKSVGASGSEDEAESSSYRIPKKKRSTSLDRNEPSTSARRISDDGDTRDAPRQLDREIPQTFSKQSLPALPGLQPLDTETPRITKKTPAPPEPMPSTPGYDDDLRPIFTFPTLQANPTPDPRPDVTTIHVAPQRLLVPSPEHTASSGMSTCSASEDEGECQIVLVENDEALKEAHQKLEHLRIDLQQFPVKMQATRVSRPFSTALILRKLRRCQSTECLSDFFNTQADLEMFGKNFEGSFLIQDGVTPAVVKVAPPEPTLFKNELTTEIENRIYENLVKENLERLENIQHPIKEAMKTVLPHLVTAYSNDDDARFKEIFLTCIPKRSKFDPHRFAIIVFMISYFKHLKWDADPKGNIIVEASESKVHGMIREHNPLCSQNHRKCTWLRLFMELIPRRYRFTESSEMGYNGEEGDDGPFRDDVYFHCMKRGAECQKRLFFEFEKPIGLQEDDVDEYRVDGMHLLAVQYGNLQRIASYMSLGGADINALATHWKTKHVYRLHDYLKFWIDNNVTSGDEIKNEHMAYYNNLLLMIRHTSESLESFVKGKVNEIITTRMNMMFKIHMDLTFPHIIRCSTISNEDNQGDGSHQVLACLFSPLGVGLRDGLPVKEDADEDKEVKKLRAVLGKYQKLVARKQGRLVVALYRVEIDYKANVETGYKVPNFRHVVSNDGFKIDEVNILRQKEHLPGNIAHIDLDEHTALTSPGALYYVIKNEEREQNLVVPGNAHIEIIGKFDRPMSFVAQVFYLKKNF